METSKEIQQLFIDDVRSKAMYTGKRATGSARVMFASNLYIPKEESRVNELKRMEERSIWLRWPEFTKKPKHEQCNLLKLWLHEYRYSPMEIANSLHCKLNNITALIKFHKIMPQKTIPAPAAVELKFMSYELFKLLSDEERISTYDEYKKRYGTERGLAEAWKVPTINVTNLIGKTRRRIAEGVIRNDSMNMVRVGKVIHKEEATVQEVTKSLADVPEINSLMGDLGKAITEMQKELKRLQEIELRYNKIREALAEV